MACMTCKLWSNACIPSQRQSCDKIQAWNNTVIAVVHDVAGPARRVGAEDAEQDGQSASQISGEAARYADRPGNIGHPALIEHHFGHIHNLALYLAFTLLDSYDFTIIVHH